MTISPDRSGDRPKGPPLEIGDAGRQFGMEFHPTGAHGRARQCALLREHSR
ncbi:MAG: hypothetical protein AB7G13_06135 [Lautropia sp.]